MSGLPTPPPSADRTVLVGVTGGIAIYKAVELVRGLVKDGLQPLVVTTEAARRFVMPLTFAAVSQAPVLDDESAWQASGGWFQHIEAARTARVMVVAPATANTLAKMAAGIADNLLTAIYLAFRGPTIVAPTMNWAMNEHPATRENLRVLAERGVEVLPTEQGDLACGEEGSGRMVSPDAIRLAVRRAFASTGTGALAGKKVVVTSGGTRERIDAVRFIGNRSSGRQGYAIAEEAARRGADVTLVSGPTQLADPFGVRTVRVETAAEMLAAVVAAYGDAGVVIAAAAVADLRPAAPVVGKIAKADSPESIGLERTVDILALMGEHKGPRTLVGFAAEAGDPVDSARAKLAAKHLDLIVANDVTAPDAGFDVPTNRVTLIDRSAAVELPLMDKRAVARAVLDRVEALRKDVR